MQIVWEFPHRETGALCRAVFDGGLLEVDIAECVPRYIRKATLAELSASGIAHTCVANRDAAYRELRLHADSSDLDRSETVQ